MVDIARDPRWGRVMEGAGEDPYLGSLIATARVKGFQGKGLGNTDAVMACAKHFAAYGAAIGGRDYNSVDMSHAHIVGNLSCLRLKLLQMPARHFYEFIQ